MDLLICSTLNGERFDMIRLFDYVLRHQVMFVFWGMLAILVGVLMTGCDLSTQPPTATVTMEATVEATAQPDDTATPDPDPSPTRIVTPEYFKCAKPVRLPAADICFPVGFSQDTPEMEANGNPSGVVFVPGEFIAVNLSESTTERCILQGSNRWVDCGLLIDESGRLD